MRLRNGISGNCNNLTAMGYWPCQESRLYCDRGRLTSTGRRPGRGIHGHIPGEFGSGVIGVGDGGRDELARWNVRIEYGREGGVSGVIRRDRQGSQVPLSFAESGGMSNRIGVEINKVSGIRSTGIGSLNRDHTLVGKCGG